MLAAFMPLTGGQVKAPPAKAFTAKHMRGMKNGYWHLVGCVRLVVEFPRMKLSESFSIDPNADWVKAHNAEVREVLAAHEADKPIRVPMISWDGPHTHGFYADEINLDYRDYYTNVELMLQTQLEAARRRREIRVHDLPLAGPPDEWPTALDMHPIPAPGWLGCEVVLRETSVPAHRCRHLSKDACREMQMPDPRTGNFLATIVPMWEQMKKLCDRLTFLGAPVARPWSGVCQHGVFGLCIDLRGEDFMVDMYEAPGFAHEFILKVATWCDALEAAWREDPSEPGSFGISDHGIEMLSPQLYEDFVVPVIWEINRRRGTPPPTTLHHCGSGVHLFPIIQKHFGLTLIDSLTFPLVDVAKVRRDLGEDIWINAGIESAIIRWGPAERIRQTVKDLLASAKGSGRFAINVGDMLRGVPMEHRIAYYEAVREFGAYY